MKPFFSIITPSFNREKFLSDTIKSVLRQSFENFEYIIIDDASIDNTREIVESFNDSRIFYYRNEHNVERGASRNKGIELSRGKYICFLDSDDAFLPNHLKTFYDYIQFHDFPLGLFFTSKILKTDDLHETKDIPIIYPWKNKFSYILRYTFNPTRVCVSKDVFNYFVFDPTIPGLEDIDLWLHIATKYQFYQLPEFTSVYFVHKNSYSIGDEKRFLNELNNFKYVFNKPEIRHWLPSKEKRLLLSKCHYFLAIEHFNKHFKTKTLYHSLKAFFYYPIGYNHNANRTIFVMFLYSLPILGNLIRVFTKSKY